MGFLLSRLPGFSLACRDYANSLYFQGIFKDYLKVEETALEKVDLYLEKSFRFLISWSDFCVLHVAISLFKVRCPLLFPLTVICFYHHGLTLSFHLCNAPRQLDSLTTKIRLSQKKWETF